MFSALWDIISSLVSAFFQVVGALGRGLLDVLSALASAVLWPIRAASGILFGNWDVSSQWTPLYLSACGVLLAALILFFLLGPCGPTTSGKKETKKGAPAGRPFLFHTAYFTTILTSLPGT